jgi:amidohydrolase
MCQTVRPPDASDARLAGPCAPVRDSHHFPRMRLNTFVLLAAIGPAALPAQAGMAPVTGPLPPAIMRELDMRIAAIAPKVVAWRRDIHQHPEIGGSEVRTSALVAAHLRALGLEVRTEVAGQHGVIGILRGARPGPGVALRADMDALPVTEQTGLPFASHVTAQYNGQTVGVMHACGHDAHTAVLMGVAEVLTGMRSKLPGTVTFLFQPDEEGDGGAAQMLKAGAFESPHVDAVYGLHTWPAPSGTVLARSGGMMASIDEWRIVVHGKQAHGAQPWRSIDPIVIGAQIIGELQTIVSRSVDLPAGPAVVTVGVFNGGIRSNIIPDSAVMYGTYRAFSDVTRNVIREQIQRIATNVAEASGATATVTLPDNGAPATVNDPRWYPRASNVLRLALGAENVLENNPSMPSEDFSFFLQRVPGMFLFLGITPKGSDPATAPANHSPLFVVDEAAFPVGVKALSSLALDALFFGVPKLNVTP